MAFFTAQVTSFAQLSGSIELSQIPDDIFTADADGRAPFQDGVINSAKILDGTVSLSDIGGDVIALFI